MPLRHAVPPVTEPGPAIINLDTVRAAKLETSPYEHLIVSDFIQGSWKTPLYNDYPIIRQGGSLPLSTIDCGEIFTQLIDEMNSDAFRKIVEDKFSVDLRDKPTMFTVRGNCRPKDGKVHTDSESKIITVLLYMNQALKSEQGQEQGGRLRLLRSNDINDVACELPPDLGTLLIFKRSNRSFHGHLPFDGPRKVIQMNWVTHQKYVEHEQKRHVWSYLMKKLGVYS